MRSSIRPTQPAATKDTSAPHETLADASTSDLLNRFWRRFVLGVLFGVIVLFGLAVLSDAHAVFTAFQQFRWRVLPLVLALTLTNYLLRFVKWQLYLRWLDLQLPSRWTSWLVFLSGLAMTLTPGKVGEFLKAAFIRRFTPGSVARAVPIVLAERLTDGIAMLLLAVLSASIDLHISPRLFLLLLALVAVGILVLLSQPFMERVLQLSRRLPLIGKQAAAITQAYHAAYALFLPGRLLSTVLLGLLSWSGECLALGLILYGLGVPLTRETISLATFALSSASIAGALSLLPGGLGVAEAGIAGVLLVLGSPPITTTQASAATVLIRCSTLWFGIVLGLVALLALLRLPPQTAAQETSPSDMA